MNPEALVTVAVLCFFGQQPPQKAVAPERFVRLTDMGVVRWGHTATVLSNGKVLIVGGSTYLGKFDDLNSAMLYDPVKGAFAPTGTLHVGRSDHTATLLKDGRVLISGGRINPARGEPKAIADAEIYDPGTESFTLTGKMHSARDWDAAVLLADGRVLVCGGLHDGHGLASAEIYDPTTGLFTPTKNMGLPRAGNSATLLPNRKVLVASEAFAELYDPVTGSFARTGNLTTPRLFHTSTLLPNGQVLLAGGIPKDGNDPLASAELYDPTTGKFAATSDMNYSRRSHTATLLKNGRVLIVGGESHGTTASAEIFDFATAVFHSVNPMTASRYKHQSTLLPDGSVLVTGGASESPAGKFWYSSAELFISDPLYAK